MGLTPSVFSFRPVPERPVEDIQTDDDSGIEDEHPDQSDSEKSEGEHDSEQSEGEHDSEQSEGEHDSEQSEGEQDSEQSEGEHDSEKSEGEQDSEQSEGEHESEKSEGERDSEQSEGEHDSEKSEGEHDSEKSEGEHESEKSEGERDSEQSEGEHDLEKSEGEHDLEKSEGEHDLEKSEGEHDLEKSEGEHDSEKSEGEHDLEKSEGEHDSEKSEGEHDSEKSEGEHESEKSEGEHESEKSEGEHDSEKSEGEQDSEKSEGEHDSDITRKLEKNFYHYYKITCDVDDTEVETTNTTKTVGLKYTHTFEDYIEKIINDNQKANNLYEGANKIKNLATVINYCITRSKSLETIQDTVWLDIRLRHYVYKTLLDSDLRIQIRSSSASIYRFFTNYCPSLSNGYQARHHPIMKEFLTYLQQELVYDNKSHWILFEFISNTSQSTILSPFKKKRACDLCRQTFQDCKKITIWTSAKEHYPKMTFSKQAPLLHHKIIGLIEREENINFGSGFGLCEKCEQTMVQKMLHSRHVLFRPESVDVDSVITLFQFINQNNISVDMFLF